MKRFYRRVEVATGPAGHRIFLDGRPAKTPRKYDLTVPSAPLAAALAAEWEAQQDQIRPAMMPLTRLAGATIDRDPAMRDAIVRQIAGYAGTDLVCYRAAHPPALTARQEAVWRPLVDWAVQRYGARLTITSGVMPAGQPPASVYALEAAVAGQADYALTALHAATAACGSLVIGLALVEGHLDAAAAFAASQLDEAFQIEAWGEDAEQGARRRALALEIEAAARLLFLLGDCHRQRTSGERL